MENENAVSETDQEAASAAPEEGIPCPDCQSINVRPSRSAYPRDKETNPAGLGSFWRCRNCGNRFLGPFSVERKSRRSHRHGNDPLGRRIQLTRYVKRWFFPVFVILMTIMAVMYLLERRNSQPMQQRRGISPRF